MSAVTAPVATPILSLKDVREACIASKKYGAAVAISKAAEEKKKKAAMVVFEALLGVKSEDDVRSLSPEQLKRLARRRISRGLVVVEGLDVEVLLEKVIQKSKSERRPSWKDCFVAALGESKAAEIQNDTAETFSYKFVESALS
jgi:hypothetical protein